MGKTCWMKMCYLTNAFQIKQQDVCGQKHQQQWQPWPQDGFTRSGQVLLTCRYSLRNTSTWYYRTNLTSSHCIVYAVDPAVHQTVQITSLLQPFITTVRFRIALLLEHLMSDGRYGKTVTSMFALLSDNWCTERRHGYCAVSWQSRETQSQYYLF